MRFSMSGSVKRALQWSECSWVMKIASISSRVRFISCSAFFILLGLIPASTNIFVSFAFRKAQLPWLELAMILKKVSVIKIFAFKNCKISK